MPQLSPFLSRTARSLPRSSTTGQLNTKGHRHPAHLLKASQLEAELTELANMGETSSIVTTDVTMDEYVSVISADQNRQQAASLVSVESNR